MSNLFWLTDAQMARLEPFFPKSHGKPRVDDRRVLSGIIFVNRNGLRWRDAPKDYGPPKTLYNRWKRWSDRGVFARMMDGLAAEAAVPKTVMIDATYLKAHRTATSLRSKKGAENTAGRPLASLAASPFCWSRTRSPPRTKTARKSASSRRAPPQSWQGVGIEPPAAAFGMCICTCPAGSNSLFSDGILVGHSGLPRGFCAKTHKCALPCIEGAALLA